MVSKELKELMNKTASTRAFSGWFIKVDIEPCWTNIELLTPK